MTYRGKHHNPAANMVELQILRYQAQNGDTPRFPNLFNDVSEQDNKTSLETPKTTPKAAPKAPAPLSSTFSKLFARFIFIFKKNRTH